MIAKTSADLPWKEIAYFANFISHPFISQKSKVVLKVINQTASKIWFRQYLNELSTHRSIPCCDLEPVVNSRNLINI